MRSLHSSYSTGSLSSTLVHLGFRPLNASRFAALAMRRYAHSLHRVVFLGTSPSGSHNVRYVARFWRQKWRHTVESCWDGLTHISKPHFSSTHGIQTPSKTSYCFGMCTSEPQTGSRGVSQSISGKLGVMVPRKRRSDSRKGCERCGDGTDYWIGTRRNA